MRRMLAIGVAVTGCWTASAPRPASPPPPAATTTTKSTTPPASAACVFDAAAKQACDARGPQFAYGPRPYIYCSGVAPDPDAEASIHEQIRQSPCMCFDQVATENERELCSRVP